MYDLKKVQTIAQANIATIPIARPRQRVRRRPQPAINVRNPRLMMGMIFLFLLLAYLIAYAQDAVSVPQPYLIIEPTARQMVAPSNPLAAPDSPASLGGLSAGQPLPIPRTGN